MKSVLHAADYSRLHSLALYNVDEQSIENLFTDQTLSTGIFQNQIRTLILTCNSNEDYFEMLSSVAIIFQYLFPVLMKLTCLILHELSYKDRVRLNFDDSLIVHFRSSTLLKLKINAQFFYDCLHLLDGRFNQLDTLIINLVNLSNTDEISNEGHLPNLKYFSLSCQLRTSHYNEAILPLLYRMSNLQRLALYLQVKTDQTFLDGKHLKENILNPLKRLNQFQFSITSHVFHFMQLNLPSTKEIRRTFIDFPTKNIISYVDYFGESNEGQCHMYSYPSEMTFFSHITNQFPGGLYSSVRQVSLIDKKPFEHQFFLRIAKSFPLMEILYVDNNKAQSGKQFYQSNENEENVSLIQYSSLRELRFGNVHDHYIEQFLSERRTHFSKNLDLCIEYQSLERITHNFTRETMRKNCTNIHKLFFFDQSTSSKSLQDYFPYAKIFYK